MVAEDPRRRIPRTDALLGDPALLAAAAQHGVTQPRLAHLVREVVAAARRGEIDPGEVGDSVLAALAAPTSSTREVLNATGVVIHTNLGRAPLSAPVVEAIVGACGYVDVELDLASGVRATRGSGALDALLAAVPVAQGALVVNSGAAALVLATTALAGGRSVLMSRGEMVEIGDGFRLHELIASAGARVVEVGTTNRTRLADYAAVDPAEVGAMLKVHPSNFVVQGFVQQASIAELSTLPSPLVVDIGSGLLAPDPDLPEEPDAATALAEGAGLVLFSGDKLLGGPQAGIILGRADLVATLRRHPLYRAVRTDKLTLAAIEAAVRHAGESLVAQYRRRTDAELRQAAQRLHALLEGIDARVVPTRGRVGGGSAPGITLPGWGIALPEDYAQRLRVGEPPVLARVADGVTIVDVRCLPQDRIEDVAAAIRAAGHR